jgi:WD40 repeat protein
VLINAESWKGLAAVTGRTNLRCAAFSPDGNLAAIGSEDGTVDLRDGRTGALIRLLWAHSGAVNSVQFSADSSRLLTASADRTAVVSRVPDGNMLFVFEGHADAVLTACFSADDSQIVTSSRDKSARIWSGRDGSLIASLADHLKPVSFAHFSPDGKFVVTGSDDGTAKLWSTTGQLLQSIEMNAGEIQCAEFSPDSRRLITGAKEAVARVWDLSIESRSPSEVDELIRQRVPPRLAEIVEPSPLGAMSTRDASRKHVSSSASPNGSLGTPEAVVCAFMRALDEGDPERVSALIATQCESRLAKLHERGAGRDELASIADLFSGATITETVHREDGQAAFVEILLPKGLLTVYLSTEDSDWRITTMVGRPLAQQ